MKTFSILTVLSFVTICTAAHAYEYGVYKDQEGKLSSEVNETVSSFREGKIKLQEQAKALSDLKKEREKLSARIKTLKTTKSEAKKGFKSLDKDSKKVEGFSETVKGSLAEAEAEISAEQKNLETMDQQINHDSLALEEAKSNVLTPVKFDKKMQEYRERYNKLVESEKRRAKLESFVKKTDVKPAEVDAELAATLKKNSYAIMKDIPAKTADVAVVPVDASKAARIADCQAAVAELMKVKGEFGARLSNQPEGLVCEELSKDFAAKTSSLSARCEGVIASDHEVFHQTFSTDSSDADLASAADDASVSAMLKNSSASVAKMVDDKCKSLVADAKGKKDLLQGDVCKDVTQDQAIQAMVKGSLDKNSEMLTNLFSIATLKMAHAMAKNGATKTSLEASIVTLLKAKANGGSTLTSSTQSEKEIKALYDSYGRSDDRRKLLEMARTARYGSLKTRMTNDNASALMLLLKKEKSDTVEVTDFNDLDVAAVWAVEKIRKFEEKEDGDFGLGKAQGNQLNFSTRVYALAYPEGLKEKNLKRGPATQENFLAEIQDLNKKIDSAIDEAFANMSSELKSCFLKDEKNPDGSACKLTDGLNPSQRDSIRAMIVKLADRAHTDVESPGSVEAAAIISPDDTVSDEGEISLNWKSKKAK